MKRQGDAMKRQGDVLLTRVETVEDGKDASEEGRIILAHGEATGHAHEVVAREKTTVVKLIESVSGNRDLTIDGGEADVVHQEHGTVTLEPGNYRVIRQHEWTDANEPRPVPD